VKKTPQAGSVEGERSRDLRKRTRGGGRKGTGGSKPLRGLTSKSSKKRSLRGVARHGRGERALVASNRKKITTRFKRGTWRRR